MNSPEIYLAHREFIEDAIAAVCRRRRLAPDEAEEFASDARLHLIRNDYAVLRAFEGRSSIRTYVIAVLSHLFLDWRNARWGKWRPSAEAKRLGPLAVKLETMTVRDRLSLDEAYETLQTNYGISAPRADIEAMAARFPDRPRRSFLQDDALEQHAAAGADADAGVMHATAVAAAERARGALSEALAELDARDRLILEMRYTDGHRVQDIARLLDLDPKPLYRRIERLLAELRRGLEARGVTAAEAMEAIEQQGFASADTDAPDPEFGGDVRPFVQKAHSPASEGRRP
ncbi:MAG TPA: sigma-70 family RNA polymerase sigma factor [Vicinamibacterales bacterium]